MQYEIVATLGPATPDETAWSGLLAAGASAFRLNTSHLTLAELETWLGRLEPFLNRCDPRPALTLDLQGSKWRLGVFPTFELRAGQAIELICAAEFSRPDTLPVPHADFFAAAAQSSGDLALNDAKIGLSLETWAGQVLRARVTRGGTISPRKGITFSASEYRQEGLNERDRSIWQRARGLREVRFAISYVRDALEMAHYRAAFGPETYLAAKIERRAALDDLDPMCAQANELWLCRGDLGAELGLAEMAAAAHRYGAGVRGLARPALLAGQVFEHLTAAANPTRAEVCGLYDALSQGYAGVVLSDETAVGQNPPEAVRAAALFRDSINHSAIIFNEK